MKILYNDGPKERLDKFLSRQHPEFSRTQIQKWISQTGILVNGKPAAIHHWLKSGDLIEMPEMIMAVTQRQARAPLDEPQIIYQDDAFAIVVKPAGLLIHPTEKGETETLAHWLQKKFPQIATVGDDPTRPGIVHRLDKDVGGLVLIALTSESFEHFKILFQNHAMIKKYRCLVHGTIPPEDGQIATPLERDKKSGRMIAQSGTGEGKEALTLYTVVSRYRNFTLLDVQIVTGRTHQIRAHLYSIGHSVVGDPLYQTRDVRMKKNQISTLARPFLFAYYLSFSDRNGQLHEFQAPVPSDLQELLTTLT